MILPRFYFTGDFSSYEELVKNHGGTLQHFRKGEVLEGAHTGILTSYFIKKGIAKLSCITEDGRERVLLFHGKDSIYPINCISDNFPTENYMFFTAVSDMEVLAFPSMNVIAMTEADNNFTVAVMNYYCRYANLMLTRSLLATYADTSQLVSSVLYLMAKSNPSGEKYLDVTQEELGNITGLSRMQITRVLGDLRESGIVQTNRGNIAVLDLIELKRRCSAVVGEN